MVAKSLFSLDLSVQLRGHDIKIFRDVFDFFKMSSILHKRKCSDTNHQSNQHESRSVQEKPFLQNEGDTLRTLMPIWILSQRSLTLMILKILMGKAVFRSQNLPSKLR